jgi:hypothetical protein
MSSSGSGATGRHAAGDALVVVPRTGPARAMARRNFGQGDFSEAWLRDAIFAHPNALPLREIDPAGLPLVPVCTELTVSVGRIDAVFIDQRGRLTLVECKLWQNPEARRKVVAQILDYAAELSRWTYADLQRQVAISLGRPGNSLFEKVAAAVPGVDEAAFVDGVSRGLQEGDFTLIVLGDGIRAETHQIAEYLVDHGRLKFRFGLVEVAIYDLPDGSVALHPRVRARTELVRREIFVPRFILGQADGGEASAADEPDSAAPGETPGRRVSEQVREADRAFWDPFLRALHLDDPEQPVPLSGGIENRRFRLPMGAWITAWRTGSAGANRIGVMFRLPRDAHELREELAAGRAAILAGLPPGAHWDEDGTFHNEMAIADINDPASWDEQRRALAGWINAYINVFRPWLLRLAARGSD